jgi:hypothetical protein
MSMTSRLRRGACAIATMVVATLAMSSAASAASPPWAIQPTPNAPGFPNSSLAGVPTRLLLRGASSRAGDGCPAVGSGRKRSRRDSG